jgi:AcrR family transcriptional regulator
LSSQNDLPDRIVAEALRTLAERGYHATALAGIALRLGVSKAAIYHHFPSKRELLAHLALPFLAEFDDALTSISLVSLEDEKAMLLESYFMLVLENAAVLSLLLRDRMIAEDPVAIRFKEILSRLMERLAPAPAPATDAALRTAACAIGAIHGAVLDGDGTPPPNEGPLIVRAALSALTAGDAGDASEHLEPRLQS